MTKSVYGCTRHNRPPGSELPCPGCVEDARNRAPPESYHEEGCEGYTDCDCASKEITRLRKAAQDVLDEVAAAPDDPLGMVAHLAVPLLRLKEALAPRDATSSLGPRAPGGAGRAPPATSQSPSRTARWRRQP